MGLLADSAERISVVSVKRAALSTVIITAKWTKCLINAFPDIEIQIGVANRVYYLLSQSEIAGAKRISRHLS